MIKKILKKLLPKLYPQKDNLFIMWKSTIDMRIKPEHAEIPLLPEKKPFFSFADFKSEEEMQYEADIAKYNNTFWLCRIFTKKPVIKQQEMINCRCVMPDIDM